MIKSDFHMHSYFSGDSDAPTMDMINSSIDKGLNTICFTEHFDPLFPCYKTGEEGMFDLDLPKYLEYAKSIKSNDSIQSKIKVLFGMELGVYPGIYDKCKEITNSNEFDFIICSSHVVNKLDPYYPDFWLNRTPVEGARIYFKEILTNVQNFNNFDVYGHIDYCLRYVEATNEDLSLSNYRDIIEEIFKILINNGKGIEINSGGMRKKNKVFNPSFEYIKLYKEMGGEIITFGSDAHDTLSIASHSSEAYELLKEAGFKYLTVFDKRKPAFINLH
ncbi:MAG: histidinol-phosphatase HisJ family protein [Lachnospiraceae bacterium]|nr:histidinol-phosphatase HisJ family protein [Lachnospiraceae bacterium]